VQDRGVRIPADAKNGSIAEIGGHRYLLLTATVMSYLVVTMGGLVCITGSAMGCPDWPGCYGQIIPPMRIDSIIEYTHRFSAALAGPFVLASAILGWRKYRRLPWVSRPPVAAIVFMLAAAIFGALAVLRGLSPGVAAIDLGSALITLALMVIATVAALNYPDDPVVSGRLSLRSPLARLALVTSVAMFFMLVSGVLVAEGGSIARCVGWPLFSREVAPVLAGGLAMARELISVVTGLHLVVVVIQAWRGRGNRTVILPVAMAMGILFLLEMAVGAPMATSGVNGFLMVTYVATPVAAWSTIVAPVMLAGLDSAAHAEERLEAALPSKSAV
jgi:cytochrome c oxidase assembly protein subunit 15